jgi:Transposase
MYLKKSTNSKTGRTQLSIVEGFRDKNGITRTRVVKNIGFLDVVEKEYKDPIPFFTAVAKQMTAEKKVAEAPILLEVNRKETLPLGTDNSRNFGYLALSKIYHQLGIREFWANRQNMTRADYNLNSIFRALVFSRLVNPDSKKGSFEAFGHFFDKADFSLDALYRSLTFFTKYQSDLLVWIHERIRAMYGRDTSLVYYDVTNYYFETDREDNARRRGVSKEHRPNPILQMGLFMDTNGLPVSYGLFPGNALDKQTLLPLAGRLAREYQVGRIIVVADRGIITGDNIASLLHNGNGYVFSYSVRSSDNRFKEYVLDETGYRAIGNEGFRIKYRLEPRDIWVTQHPSGKRKKYR